MSLKVNFIGNFGVGYVGEQADEVHLARELARLGHQVTKVPRDVWKAFVDGDIPNPDWQIPMQADINIIAKWDAFNDRKYIDQLRAISMAPVLYWVWDFMFNNGFPDWHLKIAEASDLYLSGEAGVFDEYKKHGVRPYYFQMDVCDGDLKAALPGNYYDIVFTGSYLNQGHRIEYLKEITEEVPVHIFAWNAQDWRDAGFENVHEAVYGEDYNRVIADAKIVLGMSVEPYCFGYWSNRIGKVIHAGGFLLQEYAPGMEQFLPECVEYFSTPKEAVVKINYFLKSENEIAKRRAIANAFRFNFTSANKMGLLVKLIERYLKSENENWNSLAYQSTNVRDN